MKRFIVLFIILISISIKITANATPYISYNYDDFGDAVPSQAGYTPKKIVSHDFEKPQDIFFFSDNFYIADTQNNRIVVLDNQLDNITSIYDTFIMPNGSKTSLNQPEGVFVSEKYLYIADTQNERLIVADFNSKVVIEIKKPVSEVYDQNKTFQPSKVIVDKSENIYVISENITTGCMMFNKNGEFIGFYSSNNSEVNTEIIRNYFVSEKKKSRIKRSVPTGINNFDISESFVYTCTENSEKNSDIIKKFNASGKNVFYGKNIYFGDYQPKHNSAYYSKPAICDIDISENGNIVCLDRKTGHIFQYDKECKLLFIMGNISEQSGGFEKPSAIETANNNIYVLDSKKNNITVFSETDFGKKVHKAVDLYNLGYYSETLELWYDILKYDGNYTYAYNGIAYALLRNGDYKSSMKYARLADNSELYNKAFEEYRTIFLKENIEKIFIAVIVLVIFVIFRKRGGKKC